MQLVEMGRDNVLLVEFNMSLARFMKRVSRLFGGARGKRGQGEKKIHNDCESKHGECGP